MFNCASQITRIARLGVDSAQPLVRRHYALTELLRPAQNYNTRWLFSWIFRSNTAAKRTTGDYYKNLQNYCKLKEEVLVQINELEDMKEDIEHGGMVSQVMYLIEYGEAVLNFANSNFECCIELREDPQYEVLRTTLTKFFMEPSEDQKNLSTLMKRQILEIEELKNHDISEIIDRFLEVYGTFVSIRTNQKFIDLCFKYFFANYVNNESWNHQEHEWFSRDNLRSFVDKAPVIQDYDEKLRCILVSQTNFDLKQ